MSKQVSKHSQVPSMISFVVDLPNILSLAGLLCGVLGIYYALLENFYFALIGILWAAFFDWADGIVARKIKGRTDLQQTFGQQLDSLIDVVSFGVFPSIFLLSYGRFSLWFFPGAFLIIAASVIRLSYFNIFGLNDDNTYKGLALDNNVIVLSFLFLFEGFFGHEIFSILLYIFMMILLIGNLSSVRIPKFTGKWFYALIIYILILTVLFVWMEVMQST